MKITYPLSTLPEHIHSTICTINQDGGMCYKTNVRAKREQRHKHNTNSPKGLMHKPRPRRSIARPSGQVSSQEGHNNPPVEGLS